MGKKLSLAGVAEELGISKTIISFILSGKAVEKNISEDKVKAVLEYVETIGYKPNLIAQSLRTGKSHTIALIVEDISSPFFAAIAKLIEDKAIKSGYQIFYASTNNDVDKTKDLIASMRDRHVDGFIISSFKGIETDINDLVNDNTPVIMFGELLSGINTDCVIVDGDYDAYKLYIPDITALVQPTENIADSIISILLKRMERNSQAISIKQIVSNNSLLAIESAFQKVELASA